MSPINASLKKKPLGIQYFCILNLTNGRTMETEKHDNMIVMICNALTPQELFRHFFEKTMKSEIYRG